MLNGTVLRTSMPNFTIVGQEVWTEGVKVHLLT